MLLGGDPNFTTPEHIIDGAAAAARAGATGYSPGGGIPPLREAIVEKVRERNSLDVHLRAGRRHHRRLRRAVHQPDADARAAAANS